MGLVEINISRSGGRGRQPSYIYIYNTVFVCLSLLPILYQEESGVHGRDHGTGNIKRDLASRPRHPYHPGAGHLRKAEGRKFSTIIPRQTWGSSWRAPRRGSGDFLSSLLALGRDPEGLSYANQSDPHRYLT